VLAPLDERQHDVDEPERHEHGADDVEADHALGAGLGHEPGDDEQRAAPIGMLMRKQLRQPRPRMSAWTSTPPISCPPTAASPSTIPYTLSARTRVGAGVDDADDREDLRAQQRRRDALHEAGDDEHGRRGGHAADARGDREEREAEREEAPAAVRVAEPAGGDEQRPEREAVAGDDPFEGGVAGVQVGLHRGHRDIDDEEVQDDHERPGEDDREGRPVRGVRAGAERGGPSGDFVSGHGGEGATATAACRLPVR
jgi:hypothetical protein